MKCLLLAAVLAATTLHFAAAQPVIDEEGGTFFNYGRGSWSCDDFLVVMRVDRNSTNLRPYHTPDWQHFSDWADGFLIAINLMSNGDGRLVGQHTHSIPDDRMEWFEAYCQRNPTARFLEAVWKYRFAVMTGLPRLPQ